MRIYIIFLLLCVSVTALGQATGGDTLSMSVRQQQRIDKSTRQIDSIQQVFYHSSDSIEQRYREHFSKLDSTSALYRKQLDRVRRVQLAPASVLDSLHEWVGNKVDSLSLQRYASKAGRVLDSINRVRDSLSAKLNAGVATLKQKTIGRLEALDLPPQVKEKLTDATTKIEGFHMPALGLNMGGPNLYSGSVPELINVSVPQLPNLATPVPGSFSTTPTLPDLSTNAGGYAADVKQLSGSAGNLNDLPAVAEAKAAELSGVNGMKDQTKALDQYKNMAEGAQHPDSLKSFVKQEVRQMAVNHFAGKEEQLKQAMEVMSKYKNKYSSISGIEALKKRPPNPMKGKPFIERLVPGVAMQMQKKGDDFMVDFNPYTGYKFGVRLTAGLGWNQRIAYNWENKKFSADARIFGPRVYSEFKIGRGFSPRVEGELMNTMVPPAVVATTADPQHREWVPGVFIGLKKEYRFIKSVRGTAMIMTRVINPDHKSPYSDVLNVRFGFEFPMKKKALRDSKKS